MARRSSSTASTTRGPARAALSRAVLLVLGLGALGGCALQPPPDSAQLRTDALGPADLQRPWRAAVPATTASAAATAAPLQDNWLQQFGDTQLDALVAEALAHNPDLRIAATRVEQATQALRAAEAALKPTLSIVGTGGIKLSDMTSALAGAIALVSWELDLWGGLRYGRDAAGASLDASKLDFEFARQSLAATTAKAWFTATRTLQEQQLAESAAQSGDKLVQLAQSRQRVGAGRELDVESARAFAGNQRDLLEQARLAHRSAARALELLLGRYPAAELQARADLARPPAVAPAGLPLDMLERRPDLRAAERRVAAAFNRVGQAKVAGLPTVRLTGNAGYLDSDVLQLKEDFENPTAGAGAKVLWPLYTGGAIEAQVAAATAQQQEAVAAYARAAWRAISDVETALDAVRVLGARERLGTATVAAQERALAQAQSSQRVGKGDQRAVEQQRLELLGAQSQLLRVRSEQLIQQVNLHLALGGSFVPGPVAAVAAASAP